METKYFEDLDNKCKELERLISDQKVIAQDKDYSNYLKEHGKILPAVLKYREFKNSNDQIESLAILDDEELKQLAEEEIKTIGITKKQLETELNEYFKNKDKQDLAINSVIMEIRAGTGGDEAALFAADLFRMYARYFERKGYKMESLSSHATGLKGFKEIIVGVEADNIYDILQYESGTHRVQRIPSTESSGRIHTSTATVAILPEPKEIDMEIKPEDLKIDTFRASGHGGQHLQKTDSAVRITHLPSGIVCSCQDERSQGRNRQKAYKLLLVRLSEMKTKAQDSEIGDARRAQIGSAKRSEKIRTYNYPQNRITDHRAGVTIHNLENILEGDLDEFLKQIKTGIANKKEDSSQSDLNDEE
ncbi:MAG: peptide chain release factor 1 [Elusimicrobia bacterium]|nr:peptide chain release factor 1 [Elusimicrobiota bacterium]MBU2614429.1 peptide chain release factor 1 [Elusimicrobiota bacterium]